MSWRSKVELQRIGWATQIAVVWHWQIVLTKTRRANTVGVHERDQQAADQHENHQRDLQRPRPWQSGKRGRDRNDEHELAKRGATTPTCVGEFVAHPLAIFRRQSQADRKQQPAPWSRVARNSGHASTVVGARPYQRRNSFSRRRT